MEHVKSGIVALYSIVEKYKLNNPSPYIIANFINYANMFIFSDWFFVFHLFIVITMDTILGVLLAIKTHKFSSWGFGKVFTKIVIYFIILIATHNATAYFHSTNVKFLIELIDSTIYAAIMVREYLSLLEKMPALGIWTPPKWILKRMQIWYETGEIDKKEENKEK